MNKFTFTLFVVLSFLLTSAISIFSYPSADFKSVSSKLEKRANKRKLISSNTKFTYYWVSFESDFKSSRQVTIRTCSKKPIATVNRDFAIEMKLEGSGVSKSGKVFNLGGK